MFSCYFFEENRFFVEDISYICLCTSCRSIFRNPYKVVVKEAKLNGKGKNDLSLACFSKF